MPEFSQRALALPASPIRKLVPFADAARQRGTHVYHLNIGQPDITTPPVFWQAIREADLEVLAYSPSAGIDPLRQEIRSYYERLGHSLEEGQVMVTTGASEALSFVFAAIMNPGDEIISPEPFYANYLSFNLSRDAKVVPVTSRIEDDFCLPAVSAFEKKITPRTRAILICNPGNPTGVLYPEEALLRLREIAEKHDLFIIADEVYREFAYDGIQHTSCLSLEGFDQNVIVVDSIAGHSSPGVQSAEDAWRIRDIVGHQEEVLGTNGTVDVACYILKQAL